MYATVLGKLRVKRRRQDGSLTYQHREIVTPGKCFNSAAHLINARRSDEDHLQRSSGERSLSCDNGRVDLTAIRVALDYYIQ